MPTSDDGLVIEGVEEAAAAIREIAAGIEGAAIEALNWGSQKMQNDAIQNAPKGVTGVLAKGIQWKNPNTLQQWVVSSTDHSLYVEYGTGPRAEVPHPRYKTLPPRSRLVAWARAHGFSTRSKKPPTIDQLRWHLMMHGTKPHPFMRPAYDKFVPKTFERLKKNILKLMEDAVSKHGGGGAGGGP